MTTLCNSCGFNNPPGMRFCGNCGIRLAEPNTPPQRLKNNLSITPEALGVMMGANLAERLQQAGIEAMGQRRNVTVLFTDLSGYTTLSGTVDSEDLYDLVQRYVQLLINEIYKYEGIVDKLTGDGLMALFGAPIAHENNAERAVRAALDMQAAVLELSREVKTQMGVDLSMRVGLHSGVVVVGGIGTNMLMDYTAIGDTVNLAHRIEEAAAPGTILISEAVFRQVRPLFDCQQVSVLNPKGIAHPVTAYRVLASKVHPGQVRGIEGLHAPMIGRDAELKCLKQAYQGLIEQKLGQLVFITGDAGLGKSRLIGELISEIRSDPIRMIYGQSLAYRRSVSYWVFKDLFYNYLGLPANAPLLFVRERLIQNCFEVMHSQAEQAVPFLERLLSLPPSDPVAAERLRYLDASQVRQQIFLAVHDLFFMEASRRPLVLILEDLHWADDASLELINFLLDMLRQAPIMILAISRQAKDGILAKSIQWAEHNLGDRFHPIPLQHLSPDQSDQLLQKLLSVSFMPPLLRDQILQRAAGIPFYLEEILRMLIDDGILHNRSGQWWVSNDLQTVNLRVPETLQGLILARFDRLSPIQRRILQVASVIGKNFTQPVLCHVLKAFATEEIESALTVICEREFISTGGGQGEYAFRHILMSDAIYATILRKERSILHGQVGEAIEDLSADHLEGQIEILANHYRYSPRLDRALHYLILAGEKSARDNVHEQARQHFEAAEALLIQVEHEPGQVFRIHMGLGDFLVFAGEYPEARQHYLDGLQAIIDVASELKVEECSTLYRKIARTYERQGNYDEAVNHLDLALATLDTCPSQYAVDRALVWNDIAWIHFRKGNFAEAETLLRRGLELVEHSDAYDTVASIYNRLGGLATKAGDWENAAGYLRKSIALRESIGDVVGLAASFNNLGYLEIEMGELNNALDNLTRSYELKNRLGQAEGIAAALSNLGWLRVLRGELEEASQALNLALDLARQIGYSSLLRHVLKNLGEMYLAAGEWDEAAHMFGEITPALGKMGANDQLLDTYRLLGEAALGAGDIPSALKWSQKAQAVVDSMQNEEAELSAVQRGEWRRFRGMLATQLGDWEAAMHYFRESEGIMRKLHSRLYQGRVIYHLGLLAANQNDRRTAAIRLREASLLFQSIGAKLEEKRAEEARQKML